MRRFLQFLCFTIGILSCARIVSAQAQIPPRPSAYATAPDISYTSVPNFIKLPTGLYLGEGIGVASNSKGHVFVYTRSGRTRLFEFDQTGEYLREIGEGLYAFEMAHIVRTDAQDNIWVVDEGSNMVIEFNPQGRVTMTLGRKPEAGPGWAYTTPPPRTPPPPAQPYVFNRPTDITWDPAGDIFISDGYGNSRVIKYDKNGKFIKSVGSFGTAPLQFNTPHTIASDAQGNIYVGDRGNRRIQILDSDLNLKKIIDNVGAPWAVCITRGPHQYLYSSNSNPDNNDSRFVPVSGEIYKMELDGTVLGKFGKPGKLLGEFSTVHEIDCRSENELLISEITSWRVQKIVLHPSGGASKGSR
jgi:DNA-binding beta-propeller fold protein YncE